MLKVFLLMVLAAFAGAAMAKGSSKGSDGGHTQGFVPIDEAQRVMHFGSERIWGTVDGVVLVCPLDADASSGRAKECESKDGKSAWTPLLSLVVPGYEISGLQYMFAGKDGYRQLLVFWRKKE
jgi:hypothetical protein